MVSGSDIQVRRSTYLDRLLFISAAAGLVAGFLARLAMRLVAEWSPFSLSRQITDRKIRYQRLRLVLATA